MSNTNFPTSIDSPTNPTANQPLNNPSHSAQHDFANDAIVALETYVGVNNSAVTSTLTYKLNNLKLGSNLNDVTITSPVAGQILEYNGSAWVNATGLFKFGGTGANGALSITTGTTTISLGGASIFVLNYTNLSITGSGALTFSNPSATGTVIVIKVQGNCTLTSSATPMISVVGMGAAGAVSRNFSGLGTGQGSGGGTGGGQGIWSGFLQTNYGLPANGEVTPPNPLGGAAANFVSPSTFNPIASKYYQMFIGAGGGEGGIYVSSGTNISGATGSGGRGGGALIMEVSGAWNFTTTGGISVAGSNGGNGTASGSGSNYGSSGGGGGAGGSFVALVGSITANTGTIVVSGGTGGNSQTLSYANQTGGAGGGSNVAGSNGTSGANGAQTGGNGAVGFSYGVQVNNDFS